MDRMPDLPENLVNPGKLQTTTQSSGAGKSKEYSTAFGWYWEVQPVPEPAKKKTRKKKRKTINKKTRNKQVVKKAVKSLPENRPWWQIW